MRTSGYDIFMSDVTVPRGSGPAKIHAVLKAEILNMTLSPGASLDETSLSVRFGMSRTPVREALVRLVQEGLARTLPNRNTIVSAIDFDSVPAYLDALTLMYRVTGRLAADRRTPADIDRLRALQAAFSTSVARQDVLAMLETNRDFHLAIAEIAGNPYYIDLSARILNEGMRLLRLYYRSFHDQLPPEFVDEHDAIIAAIEARDVAASDRLAQGHATQIIRQLQRLLTPAPGPMLDPAAATD